MKLVIAGKNFIACQALAYISDLVTLKNWAHIELLALPVKSDAGIDSWQPSLKKTAFDIGVKVVDSIESVKFSSEDKLFSLEYDKIIKTKNLSDAIAFNIHFSDLPKYRGCLTSIWPLRNAEKKAGVTLHVITDGIDDGEIIDQMHFDIPDFFTAFDLYNYYNQYAFELFKRNLTAILERSYLSYSQEGNKSTYYKRNSVDFSQLEIIDFNQSCMKLNKYVKSLIFEPYQLPLFKNRPIYDCYTFMIDNDRRHKVGQIVVETSKYVIISCKDGYLKLIFK